jgi:hypothetical protein
MPLSPEELPAIAPGFWIRREDWTHAALEAAGFQGWVSFQRLGEQLSKLSTSGGVYVVVRAAGEPLFLSVNPGGRFKGGDPSVAEEALGVNWVDGAEVVYIGKADNLRRRLREYMRFGKGEPVGHWGGRLIWQLKDSDELLVAWAETPGRIPREVEAEMISAFREAFGKPPFANEPHRLGG